MGLRVEHVEKRRTIEILNCTHQWQPVNFYHETRIRKKVNITSAAQKLNFLFYVFTVFLDGYLL